MLQRLEDGHTLVELIKARPPCRDPRGEPCTSPHTSTSTDIILELIQVATTYDELKTAFSLPCRVAGHGILTHAIMRVVCI